MTKFDVLICGNSQKWRENLASAFKESGVFHLTGDAASAELVKTAARLYPDVALWKPDGGNPLQVIKRLLSECPFTLPVILVNDPNNYNLLELVKAGIRGCLPLRLRPQQIVVMVEIIVSAGMLCLPRFDPELFGCDQKTGPTVAFKGLTGREREILSLLAQSNSNQEIATALYLSECTVKTHLRNIFRKLGVRNRTEALMAAMSYGLMEGTDTKRQNSV
ncbi:MAG: response regulator transcription factor [Bacillota bacterium]